MNKRELPEHIRDLSGAALKEAIVELRKKEIVKLVCRQTDYSEDTALSLLEENKYNYINVIKAWISPSSNTKNKKDKPAKSLNQRVIGEIRNFMDQGEKLTEYRKKQRAQMRRLQELRKQQKERGKLKPIAEENKKI
jgi:hypothetical protein